MINKINGAQGIQPAGAVGKRQTNPGKGQFGAMLQERITEAKPQQTINFSRHAMARAEERGIEVTDELMDKLAESVGKAQEKGATNILAFDANQAFIINIPYGRVITTMSQQEMKENIFTNIDGAVLL